jgi:hypothetical protein
MADPIEAHYTPDGDDWTVAVKGRGRTLTGRAPGLIAARDRADQLVEQLTPEESGRKTVVHMMNGDAVEFTTAYLTARLTREPAEPLSEEPPTDGIPEQDGTPQQDGAGPQEDLSEDGQHPKPPTPKPTPAPRPQPPASHAAPDPAEAENPTPSGN